MKQYETNEIKKLIAPLVKSQGIMSETELLWIFMGGVMQSESFENLVKIQAACVMLVNEGKVTLKQTNNGYYIKDVSMRKH